MDEILFVLFFNEYKKIGHAVRVQNERPARTLCANTSTSRGRQTYCLQISRIEPGNARELGKEKNEMQPKSERFYSTPARALYRKTTRTCVYVKRKQQNYVVSHNETEM